MSDNSRDPNVLAAITKLTEVIVAASEKCPPEKANEYNFVEASVAEEIVLATKDGRVTIEDLALVVSYQTLYLTTLSAISQELVGSIDIGHSEPIFSGSSNGSKN